MRIGIKLRERGRRLLALALTLALAAGLLPVSGTFVRAAEPAPAAQSGAEDDMGSALESLTVSPGTLSPEYSYSVTEYTLKLGDETKVALHPVPLKDGYEARVYKAELEDVDVNEKGLPFEEPIEVYDGDVLTIVCGDPAWMKDETIQRPEAASYYTIHVESKVKYNAPPEPRESGKADKVEAKAQYTINLAEHFRDAEKDSLTYSCEKDGKAESVTGSVYTWTPTKEDVGTHQLVFRAHDGRNQSDPYTVSLTVYDDTEYSVAKDASLDSPDWGILDIDTAEAIYDQKVTVTVTVNPTEEGKVRMVDSLRIETADGQPVEKTQGKLELIDTSKSKQTFTFHMPQKDVVLKKVTVGERHTLELYASDPNIKWIEVENKKDGDLLKVQTPGNKNTDPYSADLTPGEYTCRFYDGEFSHQLLRKITYSVKAEEEGAQKHYFFVLHLESDSNQLPDERQHGITASVQTPDGEKVPMTAENALQVTTGKKPRTGYRRMYYVLEALGEDYAYTYEVKPVDPYTTYFFEADIPAKGTLARAKTPNQPGVSYTYTLKIADASVTWKVSKGADLHLYGHPGRAYLAWEEYKPDGPVETSGEYDIYHFKVKTSKKLLAVAGGGKTPWLRTMKQLGLNYFGEGSEFTLNLEPRSNEWQEQAVKSTSNDIYTNVPDEGGYLTLKAGETFRLETFRVGQGMLSVTDNVFLEPEKHYEVLGDSVTVSETQGVEGRQWVELKAVKEGISFVKITYDAMFHDVHFNALDPNKTGIVIVNVGGDAGSIEPGINMPGQDKAEPISRYDTIYFTGKTTWPDGKTEAGKGYTEYTFTPRADGPLTVSTHLPVNQEESIAEGSFTAYTPNKDGSYTIRLVDGRNIVRIASGEDVRFYTINAVESDVTVANQSRPGKALRPGDKAAVSFSGLTLPVEKMAAIYNPGFPDQTYLVYDLNGTAVEGTHTQYSIVLNNTIRFTAAKAGTYRLTGGKIHATHMGSPLGAHCSIPEEGMAPNFNASGSVNDPYFCVLPDVTVQVEADDGFQTGAVQSPKASATAYNKVKVSWKAYSGAASYEIWRKAGSGSWAKKATVKASAKSWTDTKVSVGTKYSYKVRAVRKDKAQSQYSKAVSATPKLGAAKWKSAAAASSKSVSLKWGKVTGASGYQIQRSVKKASGFKTVKTVSSGKTVSGTDKSTVKAKKTYYYRMRAYRTVSGKKVYGPYSAVKAVKVVPGKVSLTKASPAKKAVTLSWKKVKGAAGYQVVRSTKKTSGFKNVATTKKLSYKNTKLKAKKTYYYKVRAYWTVGKTKVYGPYSAVKRAKTK